MAWILVVEDDDTIGRTLESNLRAHGHDVHWARTGSAALQKAATLPFDIVLLDLGLPDVDGVEVCTRLRAAHSGAVVIILTARTDEMDIVVGLDAGADDYLTKPIRLTELHARLRAHLRRNTPTHLAPTTVQIGDLLIDLGARRVGVDGQDIPVRTKEFDLLARLAAEPDVAISRATLMSDVWDENWTGSTKTLDVHVSALRHRLGEFAHAGRLPVIVSIRGHGYRLDSPPTDAGAADPGPVSPATPQGGGTAGAAATPPGRGRSRPHRRLPSW